MMVHLLLGVSLALASCSTRTETTEGSVAGSSAPHKKDPALARQWIAAGATVIDVRTPEEYAGGHIDRAVNLPVDELVGRMAEVEKLATHDQQIVVYCGSGHRAAKAERELAAAGYTHVVNGGGFDDVKPQ